MDSREAAEAFVAEFMRIYDRFRRRVKPSAYRPSPETLALLQHLARTGPLTVTEAAHHFSRSQAAMSELFARVEKRGLVARVPDRRDKRRTLVWLSDQGRDVLRDSSQVLSVRLLRGAFEQLPAPRRQPLVAGLTELLTTEPAEEGWDDE